MGVKYRWQAPVALQCRPSLASRCGTVHGPADRRACSSATSLNLKKNRSVPRLGREGAREEAPAYAGAQTTLAVLPSFCAHGCDSSYDSTIGAKGVASSDGVSCQSSSPPAEASHERSIAIQPWRTPG